ncbi:hypothetical protein [Spirosoma aerolatum]|uniref:hypothetical protein n=1 Tax=Spirosoma aerolatum TaxID=1211326 RepID=UPI0012D313C6|nr:hypothetical protein [Spirosoma aerolatum]
MIILYLLCGFALFMLCLFFYALGHARAWNTWQDATKNEKLSAEARNKLAGL